MHVCLCINGFDRIADISMWLYMLAHGIPNVAVTTSLTAVHFSHGGDACIAVLVHSRHALYVRAAQGQTRRSELKLHHWAHLSLLCLCVA